jgi:SAM-dependent methyltransferase
MRSSRRAAVEFSLAYKNAGTSHVDKLYLPNIDFWRDLFPGSLQQSLGRLEIGETYSERFCPGELVEPHKDSKVKTVPLAKQDAGTTAQLMPGRYYPRGIINKALGGFTGDRRPLLLVERDDQSLTVDLNHPLATFELELSGRMMQLHSPHPQRGGSLTHIGEAVTDGGPGMQALQEQIQGADSPHPSYRRAASEDDLHFYQKPRLVSHLDRLARKHLKLFHERTLQGRERLLDLMSSWQSHLPDSLSPCTVTGLGLNEVELKSNPRLQEYVLHDLNDAPHLPLPDRSFDAVICTVSFEYLLEPTRIIAEISRILVPGGVLVITVSNRWFPGREIEGWKERHEFERLGLILQTLKNSGHFDRIETESLRGYPRPQDDPYVGTTGFSDPLYHLVGYRPYGCMA